MAVSIGLAVGQKAVGGVVYDVTSDECYTAWLGGGAFLNGKPIKVDATPQSMLGIGDGRKSIKKKSTNTSADLNQSIISTNIGYGRTDRNIEHLNGVYCVCPKKISIAGVVPSHLSPSSPFSGTIANLMRKQVRGLRMLGSAAIQAVNVACGRSSAFVEAGKLG